MTEQTLVKAKLIELKEDLKTERKDGKQVDVQFNPESLKVTLANKVEEPKAGDQSAGTAGIQVIGAGNTKLALTLWFDVTAMDENPLDDVRRKTRDIVYFMNAKPSERDRKKKTLPGVRFSWGSFIFDGVVEGLEESLEFFSAAGKPLRASIALTLVQQKILVADFDDGDGIIGGRPGQRPFTPAKQGQSLQQMANSSGKGGGWQSIADANGIEDPLRMKPGQLIDLDAQITPGASFGAAGGVSFGATGSANLGIG